jgi:outer membrane protein TolC
MTLAALLLGAVAAPVRAGEGTVRLGETGEIQQGKLAEISKKLELETAIYLALENNYQIRQAQERVLRQMEVIREARGALLPAVTGTGSWSKVEDSLVRHQNGIRVQDTDDWNSAIEVSQNIFAGGSDWAFMRAQMLILAANKAELQALINETALGVKTRYYDSQLALAQIGVQEDLVQLREAELKNAQNRLDAGVGSNFEALRARVALSNSRPVLINARNTYDVSLQELRRYIGLPELGQNGLALSGELVTTDYSISEDDALARAANKRPEIAQLTLLVDAQKSGVRVEIGRLLPTIQAFAQYQYNRAPSSADESTLEGGMIGVRGNWNIWDGGTTLARIRQAKSDVRSAELSLDELKFNIETDVRRAYSNLVNARELVKASEQTVTEAEESLRLANSRLEVGAATQLDILDSQLQLTTARTQRIQALRDLSIAIATLEQTVGEGVRPDFVLPLVEVDKKPVKAAKKKE